VLGLRRPNFRSAKLVLFCLRGRNIVAVAMSRSQMLSMAILKQDMQFEDQDPCSWVDRRTRGLGSQKSG